MTLTKLATESGLSEVAVDGYIRTDDFRIGPNPLATLLGPHWAAGPIVLDFSRVIFIGSAGIGWLIQSQSITKTDGGRLICHSVKPQVLQPLMMFKKAFTTLAFVADRSAAMELLAAAPPAQNP